MRHFTRNTMIGLMLAGGLLMASPSMAQGRGHMGGGMESRSSQARTSSSQAREHNSGNARTSVSRSESRPSAVERRSDSRPSVQSRPTTQSRPATVERRNDSRPSVREDRSVTERRTDNRSTSVQRPGNDRQQGGQYGTRVNGIRNNAQHQENSTRHTVTNNRPSGNNNGGNRPGGYGTDGGRRPGGNNGNHNGNYGNRPGNNGNYGNRPGNNGNHNYGNRPGNNGNHNYGNRPGNNHNYGNRPGADHRYDNHRPVYRGYDNHFNQRWHNCYRTHSWGYHMPPPARPYRPAWWSFRRPPMPVGYRYYAYAPSIRSVLGITFGTLFDASLNYLFDYGYNIDGYYNNVIYVRDAYMLNYSWPDVMFNYGTAGLASVQFSYSTARRDLARFNAVYESLCNSYGQPVDSNIGTYEGQVSWWGGNGQGYVTLSYNTDSAGRFYTYLSVGN